MNFLQSRLSLLKSENRLRKLSTPIENSIDFYSSDYLGVVKNNLIKHPKINFCSGSTGSRLISGNNIYIEQVEKQIASFHEAESALIFNSGYNANVGLFSCIAQKGDTIIYDQFIHASIRDGIRLSFAFSFLFKHNNLENLEQRI